MAVRLTCVLCETIAVNGMLARTTWAYLEIDQHGSASVCPSCVQQHRDWEAKVRAARNGHGQRSPARRDPYGRNW